MFELKTQKFPNAVTQKICTSGSRSDTEAVITFGSKFKILHFALLFLILIFSATLIGGTDKIFGGGIFVSWGLAQEEVSSMKKVVMIIANQDFRDEEFLEPKAILEANDIKVVVASSDLREAKGVLGAKVKPDILIENIKPEDYAALIFVGGGGSSEYWNDNTAHSLIIKANDSGKIVAAICIAPVTLANAGVLKGKKATVWSSEANQLKSKGANYTGGAVEIDGNIITANGPAAAKKFGEAIVKNLK